MKKFNKLLLFLMDVEKELAIQVVKEAFDENEHAVLTNAAHDEVYKILQHAYDLLKEDMPEIRSKGKKPEKLEKLRLVV